MSDQPQKKPLIVCARYKDAPGSPPRFTKSVPIEELFTGLMMTLPVDEVYVVGQPEGSDEYVFKKIGVLTLDMLTGPDLVSSINRVEQKIAQNPTPTLDRSAIVEPESNMEATEGSPFIMPPTNNDHAVAALPEEGRFKTKSQRQLLTERGLEKPKDIKASKPVMSKKEEKIDTKKKGKAKPSSSEPTISNDPNDNSWLEGLPPPVRGPMGRAQVTRVQQATIAQAEAASQFRASKG